jgi:hypothetical protein
MSLKIIVSTLAEEGGECLVIDGKSVAQPRDGHLTELGIKTVKVELESRAPDLCTVINTDKPVN